ncbi:MAG: RNA polymerase sigma factor [Patulibacter sp.]
MTSGPDDALAAHELDLVTRAAQGDADAFDRFYERHAAGVQLLVERLLGPGAVADTVLIEAFEKTVRRLPLLGARNSSPRLYLLTTARNGAYAALGRDRPEPDSPSVAALLSLPSRQRELLALRELGLSEAHCAEVAGIQASEVGAQVARARLRLTDALESATLSSVFAEPRAERLLAAEVVRQEGASLPPELEQEITGLADSDARFAAALAAVRSPSRSVGQLPPASGASRLAPIARDRATRIAGAALGGLGAAATAAAPAATTPPAPAPRPIDPYASDIGDEAAWGIVDDEEYAAAPPPPEPVADQPGSGDTAWDSGTPQANAGAAPVGPTDDVPPVDGPAPTDDPLAGWDEALDWPSDDRTWAAGAGGTAAAAAAPATSADDPDATRAFDIVGAGLADPDDEAAVTRIAAGTPTFDLGDGDTEPPEGGRRSPWRFLIWVIAFALLFAGVAFAAYTFQQAKDSPSPPSSSLEPSTTSERGGATTGTTGTTGKTGSSSKATPTPKPSHTPAKASVSPTTGANSGSGRSASSSTGSTSGSSSSSGANAGSGSSSSGSGSSGGSATSSGGATTGSSTASDDRTVSGGESISGGSVRGDDTTP